LARFLRRTGIHFAAKRSTIHAMDYWIEIILRLGGATLVGGLIGLNRDLRGKPAGVRTLGIVGLASALVVMTGAAPLGLTDPHPDAISRVIQGVVTGIGFLGAGVIVRTGGAESIHGLTTAASVWLTACLGMACGIASWRMVAVAVPLAFLVLVLGGPLERAAHRWWGNPDRDDKPDA
jgi:putative Mg2+ transporter-C (MgtC) family protein